MDLNTIILYIKTNPAAWISLIVAFLVFFMAREQQKNAMTALVAGMITGVISWILITIMFPF